MDKNRKLTRVLVAATRPDLMRRPGEPDDEYEERLTGQTMIRVPVLKLPPVVYLIGPTPPYRGALKIGTTRSLRERLKGLRAHSPVPLTVMAQYDGGGELERQLHQHFSGRRHGEWFDFDGEDAVALVTVAVEKARAGELGGPLF
ncbi:GIY-YIG nuclease family protein [Streptomyces sp. NPDC048659]|uniref:GIY-YIG nuclease family protein n=1 Tax=Streptomyces sp. NPDC048659 TaxID=3155489 RepID=UPI003415F552